MPEVNVPPGKRLLAPAATRVKMTLRLSAEQYRKLRELAIDDGRSINNWIRRRIDVEYSKLERT